MPRAKRPLQDTDENARPTASGPPEKSNKKRKSAGGTAMDASIENQPQPEPELEPASIDIKFVARCCPSSLEDDDGSSSEEIEEDETGREVVVKQCFCTRPLDEQRKEHPKWAWCVSEQGSDLLNENICALCSRCPDTFGMYIYNDFEGYAMVELQENMLQAFHDAYKSKKLNKVEKLQGMWAALEAAAFWLHADGTDMWRMCDDGQRMGELVRLWGATVILMVKELVGANVFRDGKDAPITNLKLILCLFVAFGQDWDNMADEADWTEDLKMLAASEGKFALPNLHDIENDPEPVQESGEKADTKASYQKWDYTKIFNAYAKAHGRSKKLGGNHFDIGSMTSAERKSYAFDKKDPIKKGMLPPKGATMCSR